MAVLKDNVLDRGPQATHETSLLDSLRSIVADLLSAGYPNLPTVARLSGLPVRTLQRRLAHEGLTYSDQIVEIRLSRARELLGNPSWRINEIASALGYSDAANFTRAFKIWAGMTPTEYRKSVTGTLPS